VSVDDLHRRAAAFVAGAQLIGVSRKKAEAIEAEALSSFVGPVPGTRTAPVAFLSNGRGTALRVSFAQAPSGSAVVVELWALTTPPICAHGVFLELGAAAALVEILTELLRGSTEART